MLDFLHCMFNYYRCLNLIFSYKNKIVSTFQAINISKSITHSHNTSQCIEVVLKFVNHVILLNTEDFAVLYPTIIDHIMNWAQSLGIFQQTMSILQTIIVKVRDLDNYMDHDFQCDIYSKLEESLNVSKLCHLIEIPT